MAGEAEAGAGTGANGERALPKPATSLQMSPNAEFLFSAVFKGQPSAEMARRFFPTLRQWAETKKAYRGRVFSAFEVEEVIAACERQLAGPPVQERAVQPEAVEQDTGKQTSTEKVRHPSDGWWPRWVLDTTKGVEVLAPAERGKPPVWVHAKPVGIGYHGQKKRYLFVRAQKFEMDCRRSEVRMPGGGHTVEELAQQLLARGDDPTCHPDWIDSTESVPQTQGAPEVLGIAPGVAPRDSSGMPAPSKAGGDSALLEELEGDFERMALLRRSPLVKSRTCDHPDPLAEPSTAASIKLPSLTEEDIVALPAKAAEERLSSLQLETVCFAARRFRMSLPDGRAAGYMLGDGTGCGKGRCISAMICHLWNLGYRRSVWVSATSDLYYDACRDLQDLGADIPCMPMRRLPPSGSLDQKNSEAQKELVRHLGVEGNGVIFLTYSLLVQTGQRRDIIAAPVRTEESRKVLLGGLLDDKLRCVRDVFDFGAGDGGSGVHLRQGDRVVGLATLKELQQLQVPFTVSFERVVIRTKGSGLSGKDGGSELTAFNSRLGQLVAWLGGNQAQGLICFDEVHKAKNLVPDKEEHASTKTGLFVDLLQQHCPKAPVLYVSATAATEVQHLGYMSRLGVWGAGTAFENFHDFMKTIELNGVTAMEMFGLNMKAIGAMSCRSLSYVGTEFHTQQCGLTQAQRDMYNAACRFWQSCLLDFRRFVDANDLKEAYRSRFFKSMKKQQAQGGDGAVEIGKRLWQFFWGAQQRFFKAMCNALKVPAACAAAKEAVERGEQVLLSIWATGESRTKSRMASLKDETPGRAIVQSVSEGGLVKVTISDAKTLESLASLVRSSDLRLRSDVHVGGQEIARFSRLQEVHGRRAMKPGDLSTASLPVEALFRAPTTRRLAVEAVLVSTGEAVSFELGDDALGERVLVAKVLEGPGEFRRAELEAWHVKTVNDRPVGKVQVRHLRARLRKGLTIAFQDAIIPDHLSGPQMILEHFLNTSLLTQKEDGEELDWAREAKDRLLEEARALTLPANAMDEILDCLGGVKKVAEMSGRSHRMKRKKDGTLAYVARCEELRCSHDGTNLVEQVLFQKGAKKYGIVTEVASAGISLHADRRQIRKDFQPPRRTMISVELPWGADKAIQCFGRVHRANQLVPPRFIMMCTPLGGEVRFISAIARRMKLLGAVTKGDRMTSMGGSADRHMSDFDVNNSYGVRALETLYLDTMRTEGPAPDLMALYEGLPFIGNAGEGEATGRWPRWEDFASEARELWGRLNLREELAEMIEKAREDRTKTGTIRESDAINRFLNRLLMLEVDQQNAVFETFFAIYLELVRIDRANGVYDDGVELLNQSQGRWIHQIEADRREVLYTDPVTGAETQYVRLRIDRGISWEAAKAAYDALPCDSGSAKGFYAFRSREGAKPLYILVKEREQVGGAGTWLSRRRRRQYVVWRPDGCVRTGQNGGLHTFSADAFSDDRYERMRDDDAAMAEVEDGWKRSYEASTDSRLAFEHVLTGDVLSAWRLGSGASKSKGGERPQLKIVRAVMQPNGTPIVGMRVAEADLPELKYVLSCQHQSTREESHKVEGRLSIRAVCVKAAEVLLSRLSAAKDGALRLTSWLDVHKQLAASEAVPRSVDGLRGVQQAVERLAKRGFIAVEDGMMELKSSMGRMTGEELEMKLFPEEFCANEEDHDEGSEDEGSDCFEGQPDDGTGPEDASDAGLDPGSTSKLRQKKGNAGAQGVKRKSERAGTLSTPAKTRRTKAETKSGLKEPKRKCRKKKGSALADSADSDALFDDLFLSDLESGDDEGALGEVPCAKAAPRPSKALKRRSAEMERTLFGDFADSDGSGVDKAAPSKETGSAAAAPAQGVWTYEVTGNKLGIRKCPDVNTSGAGYLSPGEFFKVTEQLPSKDGRTYLRLADGRGWAYDRSAKDVGKVVVRLIKSQ